MEQLLRGSSRKVEGCTDDFFDAFEIGGMSELSFDRAAPWRPHSVFQHHNTVSDA